MNENFMVETEFLFGFQPKDRHYTTVSMILQAYKKSKLFSVHYPVSAIIEIHAVMASCEKSAADRLRAISLIRAKAVSSGLSEIKLSVDDLILCEEILAQHRSLTFFDALHASVALSNHLCIISNDEIYEKIGLKRLSFEDFLGLLKGE